MKKVITAARMLHIPGGLLFGVVFAIQAGMMLRETLFCVVVGVRRFSLECCNLTNTSRESKCEFAGRF
jgi:hypothetical protein